MDIFIQCPECGGVAVGSGNAAETLRECERCAAARERALHPLKDAAVAAPTAERRTIVGNGPPITAPHFQIVTAADLLEGDPSRLAAEIKACRERLRAIEQENSDLSRILLLTREDLTATAISLGEAQIKAIELARELAERTEETNEWRSFHEAIQNDLEQANALASDFRAQLSEKFNEIGHVRANYEQAAKGFAERGDELLAARQDVNRIQNALDHATALLRESAHGQISERRQWEVTMGRLRDELSAVDADNNELRRLHAGGNGVVIPPIVSRVDSVAIDESLRELEQKISRIREQIGRPRNRSAAPSTSSAPENVEIAFDR